MVRGIPHSARSCSGHRTTPQRQGGAPRTIERILEERNLAAPYQKRSVLAVQEATAIIDERDTRRETRGTRRDARDTRRDTRGTRRDTRTTRDTRRDTRDSRLLPIAENTFPGGRTTSDVLRPWPDMRDHVKRYVRRCACCQKMSYLKVPITTHKFTRTAPAHL